MYRVSIFEGFEPESDNEEEEDEEEEHEDGLTEEDRQRIEKLAIQDFPDDEPFEPTNKADKAGSEELDTGVQTSQLRHFVIQVSSANL